mgnify:CR=1 FL=1
MRKRLIGNLSKGYRQRVGLADALVHDPELLILDEPTAALAEHEVLILLDILRDLRQRGIACVYISHKLDEVFGIADRITVLRDGRTAGTRVTAETTPGEIVALLGSSGCGKTSTLRTLCRAIIGQTGPDQCRLLIVDFRRTLLGVVEPPHLCGYAMSSVTTAAELTTALSVLTARLPGPGVTQQQLRDRSWWSGPDIHIVVDDYDLVVGAAGNPLSPLLDLLPHASDIGLRLVVARRSGGAARAMFDPLLARMRDLGATGIVMSASAEEGPLLGLARPMPLPPGRAVVVRRGRPDELVQIAWTDPP